MKAESTLHGLLDTGDYLRILERGIGMDQKRNSTLDVLKLLASYMVVFIHVLFYGDVGDYMDALARFAVPLFFVASGYFAYKAPLQKIKKRTAHVFLLLMVTSITYTLYNIVHFLCLSDMEALTQYVGRYLEAETWLNLIAFNVPISASLAWYLLALIYVYVIYYVVAKHRVNDKLIFAICVILLCLHLVLGEYRLALGTTIQVYYIRNFLLMGFPFFGMGLLVKKHEGQIAIVPNAFVYIFLAVGIAATLFSRITFGKNELYTGSLFILGALIILFVKYPNIKYPGWINSLFGCSTYIYIFHRVLSYCIVDIYALLGIGYHSSIAIQMIHPISVCIVSTLLAYVINRVLQIRRCS